MRGAAETVVSAGRLRRFVALMLLAAACSEERTEPRAPDPIVAAEPVTPRPTDASADASPVLEPHEDDPVGERLKNYETYGKRWSQHNEEIVIRDFFDDRRDGFFVDVGSARARKMSTTYYLEKELGWRGIAIDALATWKNGYDEHRPNTKFLNYVVVDEEGERTFYRAKRKPTLSSIKKKRAAKGGGYEEIQVQASTLDRILDREGVKKIDFLSMDIEDAEPQALAGFDIDRFRPELVCIEAHRAVREPILRYFTDHGYERIEVYRKYDRTKYLHKGIGELNWYFTPKAIAAERFGQ